MKKQEQSKYNDAPEVVSGEDEAMNNKSDAERADQHAYNPHNVDQVREKFWPRYLITASILAVMVLLVAWARGGFTQTSAKNLLGAWSDAFSVPGILMVCFGLLVLGSNGGAFDMLSYAVKGIFRLFKKDPLDRKYGGFYEYQQARREKKRSFWYLIIVGGAYLLVGVVLLIVYFQAEF